MSNALFVFIKNPVLGKVKTRLAFTIGAEKALAVYKSLLAHTHHICSFVQADRYVFYSDFINTHDEWNGFQKRLQRGNELGKKMQAAFAELFSLHYRKVVIIGSDCPEITTAIIEEAFVRLDNHDVVIGPAIDGGYYLLGMQHLHLPLFENKNWSTEIVMQQTMDDLAALQLSHYLLPALNDIDEETDLAGIKGLCI